jgi:hypothetical protein
VDLLRPPPPSPPHPPLIQQRGDLATRVGSLHIHKRAAYVMTLYHFPHNTRSSSLKEKSYREVIDLLKTVSRPAMCVSIPRHAELTFPHTLVHWVGFPKSAVRAGHSPAAGFQAKPDRASSRQGPPPTHRAARHGGGLEQLEWSGVPLEPRHLLTFMGILHIFLDRSYLLNTYLRWSFGPRHCGHYHHHAAAPGLPRGQAGARRPRPAVAGLLCS